MNESVIVIMLCADRGRLLCKQSQGPGPFPSAGN